MEAIRGKRSHAIEPDTLKHLALQYPGILVDIGTDFFVANALELPLELCDLATHITINFPWGSLLNGLLAKSSGLPGGLVNVARPAAHLEIRLNAGSLAEAGWTLDEGAGRIRRVLRDAGFSMAPAVRMEKPELLACPTTWSRRLAFGRDPRARLVEGTKINPFR